jgi:N-acetylglutamate synthase-like GNAT family acetyltransferase
MADIFVRNWEQRDIPLLAHWIANTPKNLLDPTIFGYPQTTVLVAHTNKPVAALPVQLTMTLESLAFPPGASVTQKAAALAQLIKSAVYLARDKKIAELYFYTTDDSIAEFAKSHHFEEIQARTLRLRVSDLEDATKSIAGGTGSSRAVGRPGDHGSEPDAANVQQLPADSAIIGNTASECSQPG